jgi:hypothetical protein
VAGLEKRVASLAARLEALQLVLDMESTPEPMTRYERAVAVQARRRQMHLVRTEATS